MVPPEQQEVAEFLAGLTRSKPSETHVSLVYVGEGTVWKLKKAVALSFLDFTDLRTRRRLCLRELEINSPAAPGLYRDAVPIIRGPDGSLSLGTPRDETGAVDWVLRMARVPAEDFLDDIAGRGGLDEPLLDGLADTVAEYHQRLPAIGSTSPATAMRRVLDGNLRAARAAGLDAAELDGWIDAITPAIDRLSGWFDQRGADGWVRRGHGDLHLGNLCLWQGRPVPFDALEFDEDLATVDLGYDLAFLLMDLDRRVGRPAANRVLNRYVARTGDAGLLGGLPVFLSMRAIIRAHVEAMGDNAEQSGAYLAAALDYLRPAMSVVIAVGGLPGTGKSTLARALAPALGLAPGALISRSDEIRKRLHGVVPEAKLPQSAYTEDASTRVFAELTQQAGTAASAGHAVIADATFIDPQHRAALKDAAAAAGVPFIGLWLEAPLDVLAARIDTRQNDASDATQAVLQAASQSPGAHAGDWISVPAMNHNAALEAARKAVMSLPGMC
jgi:aminoglycoside phosphotransferase family enzyme/predicted kinase